VNIQDILNKNSYLKNIHAGKRCFIVGNGPSLKHQDISVLRDELSIVVTSFFRHSDAKIVKPRYWIIADPQFWENPDEFFAPVYRCAFDSAVPTALFVPTGGFSFFSNFKLGPLIDIHFYHYDFQKKDDDSVNTVIDFTKGIPPYGHNVVMIGIMLAFYMGCNPIYLIGCDHDFMNIAETEYHNSTVEHFYSEAKPLSPERFLAWDQWKASMARVCFEYAQLQTYANRWGFHVMNATKGGCLETFSRVAYEDLFIPSLNLLKIGATLDERNPRDALHLGMTAIRLMNAEDYESADALLDEAMKCNINTPRRFEGLHYLKSLCLAKLGNREEALLFARSDHASNPSNKVKSEVLIRQLEGVCGVQTEGLPRL